MKILPDIDKLDKAVYGDWDAEHNSKWFVNMKFKSPSFWFQSKLDTRMGKLFDLITKER